MQFKDKNLLRKLDMALNCVSESEEEIKSATNEDLQKFADAAQMRQQLPLEKKTYKISVPAVDEEFPELGTTKTLIYPLPISHENQCSTVGLASNLDRFSDEFGFKCKRNPKYMPKKNAGKEFALEKAYERFAFIKSLEKHKEQQAEYETMLRRKTEENTFEENVLHGDTVVAVDEDVSSDSDD